MEEEENECENNKKKNVMRVVNSLLEILFIDEFFDHFILKSVQLN